MAPARPTITAGSAGQDMCRSASWPGSSWPRPWLSAPVTAGVPPVPTAVPEVSCAGPGTREPRALAPARPGGHATPALDSAAVACREPRSRLSRSRLSRSRPRCSRLPSNGRPPMSRERPRRQAPDIRRRRSRESGATLSVGSIPVPLTAGGARATRPVAPDNLNGTASENPPRVRARQAHTSTVGRTRLLRAAVDGGCPNATGHPYASGMRRTGGLQPLLLDRERDFRRRVRSLFEQYGEAVLVQDGHLELHRLVVLGARILTHYDE